LSPAAVRTRAVTPQSRQVQGGDVEAEMRYLADPAIKPVTYNPPPGTGEQRRVGNYGTFRVRIHDARPIAEALDLDREGFALTHRGTAMRDFYDESEIRDTYYREVERLVKETTGASKAAISDHATRAPARAGARRLRAPAH